ncbi:hypothetical protein CSUB01_08021 [Colletotrichum sublineola]|uniref:Uncharacterized protein n=1 Tax=Colletotrichum sublineola TaxID=1173701 RepID=A0A066X1V8_COLSU|nr:hypothetical protein CSUB01_08021 [Colletotrichum sublineola]
MFQPSPDSTDLSWYSPYQTQPVQEPSTVVQADSSSDARTTGHGGLGSLPTVDNAQLTFSDMQQLALPPETFDIDGLGAPHVKGLTTKHSGYQPNHGAPDAQAFPPGNDILGQLYDEMKRSKAERSKDDDQTMKQIQQLKAEVVEIRNLIYDLSGGGRGGAGNS